MMPLQTAVVGGGVVSGRHLDGLSRSPFVKLVAICDLDEEIARNKAKSYGITPYGDMTTMINSESLDWIHICTPVQTHRDLSLQAIRAGINIQIEKPATVTVSEFQDIRSAAEKHGVTVSVVRNHLFDIAGRKASEKIQSGELGQIRGVDVIATGKTAPDDQNRGDWAFELPGGEFEEGVPHQIYLALSLGGYPRDIDDVNANTALSEEYTQEFDYDGLQLQWVSADDVLCSVKLMAGGIPQRLLLVHGNEKSLAIDLLSQTMMVLDKDYGASPANRALSNVDHVLDRVRGTTHLAGGMIKRKVASDWETEKKWNAHYYQIDEEARAIQRGEEIDVSLDEVSWTIQLMELVRETATRNTDKSTTGNSKSGLHEPTVSSMEPAGNND